jgi:hypothetical protein
MGKFILKNFKNDLVGVEIGVAKGENAKVMLNALPIKKLYLIDPYVNNPFRSDRVRFIKKKSEHAVADVPDNLDFVYIDGDHSYEACKKDIELYYPKVRSGGVIGGHDFGILNLGVIKAVLEFRDKTGLELQGRGLEWWFVKGKIKEPKAKEK